MGTVAQADKHGSGVTEGPAISTPHSWEHLPAFLEQ